MHLEGDLLSQTATRPPNEPFVAFHFCVVTVEADTSMAPTRSLRNDGIPIRATTSDGTRGARSSFVARRVTVGGHGTLHSHRETTVALRRAIESPLL